MSHQVTIERPRSVAFGILLIAGIVTGIFTSLPALESPDYLENLVHMKSGIYLAAVFQALMAGVYGAIAVILYPLIAMEDPGKARGYLVFRGIGTAFLFLGIVTLLLFEPLGAYVAQSRGSGMVPSEDPALLGSLLRQGRDWLNHIGMVLPWSIGGGILYLSFLGSRIIPPWMAWAGLVSSAASIIATGLYMVGLIEIVTPAYFALTLPTAVLEICLAFYVLLRGFRVPDSQTKGALV